MHFALVHGAYHGAWCWDDLRGELDGRGHESSAADLPNEDPETGVGRYGDKVLESIPTTTQEVVLVGHSLGGLTIPIVAARARAAMTVYLCALVPVPGMSFDAQHAEFGTGFEASEVPIENPDGSASWPEAGAIEVFFQDCDPDVAKAAARRLRRQQWRPMQEVTPLREWPDVRVASIFCEQDRVVSADYSRRAARDVLHIDAIAMPGGHSPFLSRPAELADLLVKVASVPREAPTR